MAAVELQPLPPLSPPMAAAVELQPLPPLSPPMIELQPLPPGRQLAEAGEGAPLIGAGELSSAPSAAAPDRGRGLAACAALPAAAEAALLAAYGLAAWTWRAQEFAIVPILLRLRPGSLATAAAYGLAEDVARLAAGPSLGSWNSTTPRLAGSLRALSLQNACGAAAGALALASLAAGDGAPTGLVVAVIASGAGSSVGSQGVQLSVEREWPARLCGADSDGLARLNARLRACDMSALLLAPAMVGLLATYAGIGSAAVAVLVFAAVAWPAQALLLQRLSTSLPVLLLAPSAREPTPLPGAAPQARRPLRALQDAVTATAATWRQSVRDPVFPAALSLALLYATVLSFGYVLVGFSVASGVTEAVVAAFRGGGGAAGFAATAAFPFLRRKLGVHLSGALGIGVQLLALAAATLPLFVNGVAGCGGTPPTPTLHALLSGVAASRFGLWLFDLAISQTVQERVPAGQLPAFLGVQSSLSAAFELMSYAATLAAPCRFSALAAASLGFVAAAAALYLKL